MKLYAEELAQNEARVDEAVTAYCNKYCIDPAFPICDVFDITNPAH